MRFRRGLLVVVIVLVVLAAWAGMGWAASEKAFRWNGEVMQMRWRAERISTMLNEGYGTIWRKQFEWGCGTPHTDSAELQAKWSIRHLPHNFERFLRESGKGRGRRAHAMIENHPQTRVLETVLAQLLHAKGARAQLEVPIIFSAIPDFRPKWGFGWSLGAKVGIPVGGKSMDGDWRTAGQFDHDRIGYLRLRREKGKLPIGSTNRGHRADVNESPWKHGGGSGHSLSSRRPRERQDLP